MERRIFFYSNPFNPSTEITYGIEERSFVELKAYDIPGIEIKTIVNAEQDAGYYEIEFNASNLPSGIYFYQLQAGDFIETKNLPPLTLRRAGMVLLRQHYGG